MSNDGAPNQNPSPKIVGKSAGGSEIIEYGNTTSSHSRMGFLDHSTLPAIAERERVYAELFGSEFQVHHELLPLIPHVDVYCFPPQGPRPFFTFITGGMSDLPMQSPPQLGRDARRIELVFYAERANDHEAQQYAELLRSGAHFAHDNQTWLHWGHTMGNGTPPSPMLGTKNLDTMLFMSSIVHPDSTLGERLTIEGDPVNLVWCVPITSAESRYKLDRGVNALYDVFERVQHPVPFAGDRESYV
jgi:hypothetical protein